jgi:hypothetical protein
MEAQAQAEVCKAILRSACERYCVGGAAHASNSWHFRPVPQVTCVLVTVGLGIGQEEFRARVVEEARRRLLEEHAATLAGFLPKGVLKTAEDLKYIVGPRVDNSDW